MLPWLLCLTRNLCMVAACNTCWLGYCVLDMCIWCMLLLNGKKHSRLTAGTQTTAHDTKITTQHTQTSTQHTRQILSTHRQQDNRHQRASFAAMAHRLYLRSVPQEWTMARVCRWLDECGAPPALVRRVGRGDDVQSFYLHYKPSQLTIAQLHQVAGLLNGHSLAHRPTFCCVSLDTPFEPPLKPPPVPQPLPPGPLPPPPPLPPAPPAEDHKSLSWEESSFSSFWLAVEMDMLGKDVQGRGFVVL